MNVKMSLVCCTNYLKVLLCLCLYSCWSFGFIFYYILLLYYFSDSFFLERLPGTRNILQQHTHPTVLRRTIRTPISRLRVRVFALRVMFLQHLQHRVQQKQSSRSLVRLFSGLYSGGHFGSWSRSSFSSTSQTRTKNSRRTPGSDLQNTEGSAPHRWPQRPALEPEEIRP